MSIKDKTGEKLVASVRKSKSGTVARKASQRPKKSESEPKSRTSAAGRSQMEAGAKPSETDSKDRIYNAAYSSCQRVWPD